MALYLIIAKISHIEIISKYMSKYETNFFERGLGFGM